MTHLPLRLATPLSTSLDARCDLDGTRLRIDLAGQLNAADATVLAAAIRRVARERSPELIRIRADDLVEIAPDAMAALRRLRHQLDTLGHHAILGGTRRRAGTRPKPPTEPAPPRDPSWHDGALAALAAESYPRHTEAQIVFAVARAEHQIDQGLALCDIPWSRAQHIRAVVELGRQILTGLDPGTSDAAEPPAS